MASQQVVIQAAPQGRPQYQPQDVREWSTGLFGCCSDIGSMLCACCCMYCMLCNVASRMGECALTPFCVPGALVAMRTKLRAMTGIRGSICCDYCALSCCFTCAMCQMDRELKHVGL